MVDEATRARALARPTVMRRITLRRAIVWDKARSKHSDSRNDV